ncbi:MAG: hypothetical protein WDZ93_02335 [Candidatus Paceibacterota bacterium]
MRNVISIVGAAMLAALGYFAAPVITGDGEAYAAYKCPNGQWANTSSACESYKKKSAQKPYRGAVAPTTVKMVCIFPMHRGSTALVVRKGLGLSGPEVHPGFRNQGWSPTPAGFAVKETCFTRAFMEKYRNVGITICGELGKVELSPSDIGHILSKGRITAQADPACMFTGKCYYR